jgi:hypothetical protein
MTQGREEASAAGFQLAENGHEAPSRHDAPTQPLGLAAIGEHCVSCGSALASDQRYCVNCGERRGKPRFILAEPAAQTVETATVPARPPRRPRASSSATLIAGIATLLIAMGVGVLIGHNNASAPSKSAADTQPLKININSGAATGTGTTPTTGAATPSTTAKGNGKGTGKITAKAKKALNKKPTAAENAKAAGAANKVLGGSAKTAAPTVTQGSACQTGTAGCEDGKFTGNNFFGN